MSAAPKAVTYILEPIYSEEDRAEMERQLDLLQSAGSWGTFHRLPKIKPVGWRLTLEKAEEGEADHANKEAPHEHLLANIETLILKPKLSGHRLGLGDGSDQASLNTQNRNAYQDESKNAGDQSDISRPHKPYRHAAGDGSSFKERSTESDYARSQRRETIGKLIERLCALPLRILGPRNPHRRTRNIS